MYLLIKQGKKLLEKITWKHLSNNYQTLMVIPLVRSTEEVKVLTGFCIYGFKFRFYFLHLQQPISCNS